MLPEPSLSCGNSTCPKTPQSGFLEEAKAVHAESNGPQRKTHALTSQFKDFMSKQQFFCGASDRRPGHTAMNGRFRFSTCLASRVSFSSYIFLLYCPPTS